MPGAVLALADCKSLATKVLGVCGNCPTNSVPVLSRDEAHFDFERNQAPASLSTTYPHARRGREILALATLGHLTRLQMRTSARSELPRRCERFVTYRRDPQVRPRLSISVRRSRRSVSTRNHAELR